MYISSLVLKLWQVLQLIGNPEVKKQRMCFSKNVDMEENRLAFNQVLEVGSCCLAWLFPGLYNKYQGLMKT